MSFAGSVYGLLLLSPGSPAHSGPPLRLSWLAMMVIKAAADSVEYQPAFWQPEMNRFNGD
jgi:hypothetical protein